MTFGVFDIETYRDLFIFAFHIHDENGNEISRGDCTSHGGTVTGAETDFIERCFKQTDYIISFNGAAFDIPVLAKICDDVNRHGRTSTRFIYCDAQDLITYDEHRNYKQFGFPDRPDWHAKHFDIFKNSLLAKSLKQWEMYSGFRIRELPYRPDELLSASEKKEIIDYCHYDVYSTARIFFERCFGNSKLAAGNVTFKAQLELARMYPKNLPYRLDRSATALAEGIVYETKDRLPPSISSPTQAFDFDDFDVCDEVKNVLKEIMFDYDEKKADKGLYQYKGICLGKGGCHFARSGIWIKVYKFDVASMYPTIIEFFKLLKTPEANARYAKIKKMRVAIKHDPDKRYENDALKKTLNSMTGAFRSKKHTAYDPAVGEAMCYIAQMIICEAATSCPEWENVIEVNTDSVFVVGEKNCEHLRLIAEKFKSKYGIVLEEEFSEMLYFRDVNNYGEYDKDGKFLVGKGLDYSDTMKKGHNLAVNNELFVNIVREKPAVDWSKYGWRDFIYKYHKSSACKYAFIGDKAMDRKNYYFLWTTADCPGAKQIQFARTLVDTHNGSVKARRGVYAFDPAELEQYSKYIDLSQYSRDLDDAFELWGKPEFCTTRVTKQERKGIKSINDVIKAFF